MACLGEKIFTNRLTVKTIAIAIGIWLAFPGTVVAQNKTCIDNVPPARLLNRPLVNPLPVDWQAILDLIHSYAWTLEDRDDAAFVALFTKDAVYEVCRNGGPAAGQSQIVRTTSQMELQDYIRGQFADLEADQLQTRHFLTNTILNTSGEIVQAKTAMLVVVQQADDAIPEIDYTAVLKMRIVKDDDIWKFEQLTLFTDTPVFIAKAR